MGIIRIEWDFGKSKADKILIGIFQTIWFFVYHFVKIFIGYFKKFRSKIKIPTFKSLDFNKWIFPTFFLFSFAPIVLFIGLLAYFPNLNTIFVSILLASILLSTAVIIIFLIFRFAIDFVVSVFCLLISLIMTVHIMGKVVLKRVIHV